MMEDKLPDKSYSKDPSEYAANYANKISGELRDEYKQKKELELEFKGTGKEYFRIWIVNLCLTLITFGIFSAWAKVRKKRYFYSHLTLDNTPFQYLAKPIPILKGRIIASVLFLLYYSSTNYFTAIFPYVLGAGLIIAPWIMVQSIAFNARYSAFRNITFRFTGNYIGALKVLAAWGIIPAIVIGMIFNWWGKPEAAAILFALFGIHFPWWIRNIKNFIVSRTSFGGQAGEFGATGGNFFSVYFVSGLIMLGFTILTVVTTFFTTQAISSAVKEMPYYAFLFMIPIYAGYVFAFAYVQANITNTVWNWISLGPLCFRCTLKTFEMVKLYLTNAIGIIASAGLLIPWAVIRTFKYRVDRTQVINTGDLSEFQGCQTETVQAAGAELTEFFDMDLSL